MSSLSPSDFYSEEDFADDFDEFDIDTQKDKDTTKEEIQLILSNYIDSNIPVMIDADQEFIKIYFYLDNLKKLYLKSLNIDPDQPLYLRVIKNFNEYSITEINNLGILEYPILHSNNSTLTELVSSVISWLQNPGKWCPICKEENIFESSKPVTCSLATCRFVASEMIGLINLRNYIPHNSELIDLLWSLLYEAVISEDREKVTEPFPEGFLREGTKDWDKLIATLNAMPKLDTIVDTIDNINKDRDIPNKDIILENYLRGYDIQIPYLIRWLVGTLRMDLIFDNNLEQQHNCKKIFNTVSEIPERMIIFDDMAKIYTVKDAFHGSPIQNWHSILRNSLKNYSCTDRQLHGAVHGKGIYLAPNISTAQGYARSKGITWDKSQFTKLNILLKAQIIDFKIKTVRDFCYVIEDENKVRISELCLF